MSHPQPGILADLPPHARYVELSLRPDSDPRLALGAIGAQRIDEQTVIGLGPGLLALLGRPLEGLHPFPSFSGPGCNVPASQCDLWIWVRGSDRGAITHRARAWVSSASSTFDIERIVDGFKFDRGLDLTGYEDGTENPTGDDAFAAAIVQGAGTGLDGGSFVSSQQWAHDLDHFANLPQAERDDIIGRRLDDNEELDGAPASAHVKRTAQESFDPEAFVVRRSMPWADATGEGLYFVAFGHSLAAFEAQLARMSGQDDGITDALFRFSRPMSGSHFWCPPLAGDHLDLRVLRL